MNPLANIWNHPRTSAAGLLIAVVSISGVLSQQGVTLGKAGTGNVVTLIAAIATALLGLMAKDPGGNSGIRGRCQLSPPGAARLCAGVPASHLAQDHAFRVPLAR